MRFPLNAAVNVLGFACAFLLVAQTANAGAKDSILDALNKSKKVFQEAAKKAELELIDSLSKKIGAARAEGNLELVEKLKAEKTAFETSQVLPKTVSPAEYQRQLRAAYAQLDSAYDVAVKAYVKSAKDDLAKTIRKEQTDSQSAALEKLGNAGKATRFAENGVAAELRQLLQAAALKGDEVKFVSFTPTGGWLVVGAEGVASRNIPAECAQALLELTKKKSPIQSVAFGPTGGWCILHGTNQYVAKDVPIAFEEGLKKGAIANMTFKWLAFSPKNGWTLVTGTKKAFSFDIPDDCFKELGKLTKAKEPIHSVSFSPDGGWAVVYGANRVQMGNVAGELANRVTRLTDEGRTIRAISFSSTGGWCIIME